MSSTTSTPAGGKAVLPEPMSRLKPPAGEFYLDQFKNGLFVDKRALTSNRLVFGRAPDCDVQLDHPSISRYHATLLWSPKNDDDFQNGTNTESFWYLIDCGSTHGTVCNKVKVDTGKMIKLRPNNNVFKFGASTRFFTLGSQSEDDDAYESDQGKELEHQNQSQDPSDDACSWGMQFAECDEEEEESGDSLALKSIIAAMKGTTGSSDSANRNAYSENPTRCMQQWFEREGQHFDYKVDTVNNNKFKCTLELPIEGQWISIEGALSNRKKDAIADACMKCCSILDQAQLLFPWQKQNASKRNSRKEYYDDDEDSDLIDETVSGSKKRQKKSGHDSEVDTYESLNAKWKTVNDELCQLKVRLATIGLEPGTQPELSADLVDSLDAYLAELNKKKFGLTLNEKIEKSNLRMKIKQLEAEQSRLEKLIQIAKPSEIIIAPSNRQVQPTAFSSTSSSTSDDNTSNGLPSKDPTKDENESADAVKAEPNRDTSEPILSHQETDQMKPPLARAKVSAKQIRKLKQESIIEAIEKEKKLEKKRTQVVATENETDFVGWLPPSNQSGDGKTHLNDKFGY